MAKYQAFVLACLVGYCLGSGGSGGAEVHQAASNDDDFRVLNVSKPLELYCNATKDSVSNYTMDWFKDGIQLSSEEGGRLNVFTNGSVKITSAKESDVGNYTCRARGESYTRTFTVLTIYVKKLPKSGTAIEKDKLTLTCEAEGNPMPTVTWMKGNISITEAIDSSRLEFKTSDKYPPNSTIIISDIVREDRGLYVCSISNHKNVVRTTTSFIRIKDIYAALWPFLGIVAEVVVLCLVIFIYEKRRTKNDFEESDTDQGGNMKDGRN